MQQSPHDCTTCPAYEQGGMAQRLDAIEKQQESLSQQIKENTKSTDEIKTDTKEIRELMELGRTAFKLLNYTGRFIKWAAGLAAAGVALYAFLTGKK